MSDNFQIQKPGELLRYLEKSRSAIAMALPKHLTPDRMIRLALTSFSTTPALRKCTPHSILSSIVVASQVGLEPGIAGQGYLIPYKATCTFVPGWQGLVGLLNNTGRATAWTGAVFEGDEFEFELGSSPRLRHVPGENFGDPDLMRWVYACGKVNGSEQPVVEAWPIGRVWKHRDRFNKVGDRHYSFEHPEMYARKVALLQVLKYMPRSIELNNAISAANAAEMGRAVTVDNGVVVEVEAEEVARGEVAGSNPLSRPRSEQRHSSPPSSGERRSTPRTETPAKADKPLPAEKPAVEEKPAAAEKPAAKAAPASEADPSKVRGYFEHVRIQRSKPDAAKPWTLWRVAYTVAGGPAREAVTFDTKHGKIIDDLEEGAEILLGIEQGAQGEVIKSIELIAAYAPAADSKEEGELPWN